jgi:hypothetical protein
VADEPGRHAAVGTPRREDRLLKVRRRRQWADPQPAA